jgi:ribosomal protein L9
LCQIFGTFSYVLQNLLQDTVLLEKKTFSALTSEEIAAMWESNNLVDKGTIKFGSSKDLLGEIKLPVSFLHQLDTTLDVNVDAVVFSSLTG